MFKTKLILIPIILVVLSGFAANGQEKTGSNVLRMEIYSAKKCYAPLAWFPVTLTLTNTGSRSVYIEKKPWGLGVYPFDEKGERRTDNPDPIHPPGLSSSALPLTDFKRIRPGRRVTFNRGAQFGRNEGKFKLVGYYRSIIFERHIPDELSAYKVWSFSDPDVQSSWLDIIISSKCIG